MLSKQDLKALSPEKEYFIGIDSDGCVFDSMELKHKECFCPAFINHFKLQGASRYARETWEFVNLYSKTRGVNRFKAVVESIRLLGERPEVRKRIGSLIATDALEAWIEVETSLSAGVLEQYLEWFDGEPKSREFLVRCLAWSNDVKDAVERIVHDLPPITEAATALAVMAEKADCMVVSQTPSGDLVREWREHDIDRFVRMIAGQEQGTKAEHLDLAAGGKSAAGKVLMIGDAPGDQKSAEEYGFLFYPIIPGNEAASWQELLDEGLDRFFNGQFAGAYQEKVLDTFGRSLPEIPPWK